MKNSIKLVICIMVSILITTFTFIIVTAIQEPDAFRFYFESYLCDDKLAFIGDEYRSYGGFSDFYEAQEELILLYTNNDVDTIEKLEMDPDAWEDYYKSKLDGMVTAQYADYAVNVSYNNALVGIVLGYFSSVVIGIAIGIMVYYIFVKNCKFKNIVIPGIICFLLIFLAFSVTNDNLMDYVGNLNPFNNGVLDELPTVTIPYLAMIAIAYVVKMVYHKSVINKLNEELNKSSQEKN